MDLSSKQSASNPTDFGLLAAQFPVTELVLHGPKGPSTLRTRVDTALLPRILSVTTRWRYFLDEMTFGVPYVYGIKNKKCFMLHRLITDCPKGMFVDHVEHDTLENCLSKLRVVTRSINQLNTRLRANRSGFRGVHFMPWHKSNPWRARINADGKTHNLGHFPTKELAVEALKKFREERGIIVGPCIERSKAVSA